jgi:hypothetical protein
LTNPPPAAATRGTDFLINKKHVQRAVRKSRGS